MAGWQAWMLILLSGAVAVWLFRMKVRPPRIVVPSLLLWRRVFEGTRELTWWERVRRAVSLAATLAVALALAMAVTRPGVRASEGTSGRLLIVLDSSWSMRAATARGETRWQRAVAEARALAQSSGSEDVALATTAEGLVEGPTSDIALIATALDRLMPAGGEGGAWPRVDGVAATHFFTDGAVVRPLDASVIVHSVFDPAPNVAITAFAARPATSSSSGASAYLEVANYAAVRQSVHLTVTRETAVLVDRRLDLAAGQVDHQVLALAAEGGARLRAHVSAPGNALDVDDEAVAWLALADPIAVTVVSDAPQGLTELLKTDPNVRATFLKTSAYRETEADVIIFDRWLPPAAPGRPALCFAPPTSSWLGRSAREELAPHWVQSTPHPTLDGVDPLTLDIAKARAYEAAGLVPVALSAKGTPLVSIFDSAAIRAVVVGFSVVDSNIASVPAFPVLVGNALEWLGRPAAGEPRAPGPMDLPASTTRVTSPDGTALALVRAGDHVLVRLQAPGLYLIETGGSRSVVGVNVGNPDIANLSRSSLPENARRSGSGLGLASRPWWIYGVVLAFVLVSFEWLTWQRRITV